LIGLNMRQADVLDNGREKFASAWHLFVEHNGDMIVWRQRMAKGGKADRRFERPAHGRTNIGYRWSRRARLDGNERAVSDLQVQMFASVNDTYEHVVLIAQQAGELRILEELYSGFRNQGSLAKTLPIFGL
jgi:hypothetical protein